MKKGDLVVDNLDQIGIIKVVEDHKPWGNQIHFKLLKDSLFEQKGEIVATKPENLTLLLTKEDLRQR
jgi:hypothetical protein